MDLSLPDELHVGDAFEMLLFGRNLLRGRCQGSWQRRVVAIISRRRQIRDDKAAIRLVRFGPTWIPLPQSISILWATYDEIVCAVYLLVRCIRLTQMEHRVSVEVKHQNSNQNSRYFRRHEKKCVKLAPSYAS